MLTGRQTKKFTIFSRAGAAKNEFAAKERKDRKENKAGHLRRYSRSNRNAPQISARAPAAREKPKAFQPPRAWHVTTIRREYK